MGLVFLSAGSYRLFVPEAAWVEMANLKMSDTLALPLMVFEMLLGLALIFNRYVKAVSIILIVFLLGALGRALMLAGDSFWLGLGELFVFDVTPTDFFLHLVFIIILLFLALTAVAKHPEDVPDNSQKD